MKYSKRIFNTIFFAIAAYALFLRAPIILNQFKQQGQKAPDFSVRTLQGEYFTLSKQPRKIVVVFWATWCGPCAIELKRINEMIREKKILPTEIIAIASHEDESIISKKVIKENYLFNVGIDVDGSVAKKFNVVVTPTIVFFDEKQRINWMTSGISPTLQYRISSFLH